jgi:predicted amidohydrolase
MGFIDAHVHVWTDDTAHFAAKLVCALSNSR